MVTPLTINMARLKRDMEAFGRIGHDPETGGLQRTGYSAADMEARRAFLALLQDEGFSARMDSVGNVIGRFGPDDAPTVMMGSHLDSVPAGGMFDGALGALAGVEVLRTLKEAGGDLPYAVEVVGTAEEEGRFGGMLGAEAITGTVDPTWYDTATDSAGIRLQDAMREAGVQPEKLAEAARAPEELRAFLEIHVEQGPVLEAEGLPVGVVEGISGCFNWHLRLEGEADHSGTTPMEMRRDAAVGAAEVIAGIDALIAGHGTDQSRVTVGQLDLSPNFPHTVAGRADFTVIGRDMTAKAMDSLETGLRGLVERVAGGRGLTPTITEKSRLEPAACSPSVIAALCDSARAHGLAYRSMPCGAGHDAQTMTRLTEAGLVFVPSVRGISHSPAEWTDWDDIEKGTNVLLGAVHAFASGAMD
ncbi:Zn-dependent hydrolase [Yunchengibacter salinarum]|uniref:Zn-dependent hydrolase n=1 Tax=Yunchengibacter salinarum TaxID=3133399 RepID=UPI0035B68721